MEITQEIIDDVAQIAYDAGQRILSYYNEDIKMTTKEDGSPLTVADLAAHEIIWERLSHDFTQIPIVSEEDVPAQTGETFWMVDPLDGTRQFIARTNEFAVNIALIHRGEPILGVIYIPVQDKMFTGAQKALFGKGPKAEHEIQVRSNPLHQGIDVLVGSGGDRNSKSILNYLSHYAVRTITVVGSSIKYTMLAAGKADLYIRERPTYEWDTAAGHAIINAAGGRMVTLDGRPFVYGKPDYLNSGFVVFAGSVS